MKSTGIVRRMDEIGRIVIPMELRKTLDIKERDQLEIYTDNGSIILRKPVSDVVTNAVDTLREIIGDETTGRKMLLRELDRLTWEIKRLTSREE